ncbi:MAG: sigma-70 family RNA polymerase sigma factor [Gemmataceae bacterium]
MTPKLGTTDLRDLLERSRAGDRGARERLAQSVYDRLEKLARQMLRRYPRVRERHETGDILNSAMIRFLHAIDETAVRDTRHFYALAAEQLRRELIDLARRLRGAVGRAREIPPGETMPADLPDPQELDSWCAFHTAVEGLPEDERAVFEPVFYHDLSQREVAEQLGVSAKTVQRRYRSACVMLYERLGGQVPEA